MGNFTARNAAFIAARNAHRYSKLGLLAGAVPVGTASVWAIGDRPWILAGAAGVTVLTNAAAFKSDKGEAEWPAIGLALGLGGALVAGWLHRPDIATKGGLLALALAVVMTGWWFARHVLPRGTTNASLERMEENSERTGKTAGKLDIEQYASLGAARLVARQVRPKLLGGATDREIRKADPNEYATKIVQIGLGVLPGENVWEPLENVTGTIGPPRTGKTQSAAETAANAPGALVITSTKADLAMAVHPFRMGAACHLVNPFGLGKFPSTVNASLLAGCEDLETATRRAKSFIPYSPDPKVEHWRDLGRPVFALLMKAAAMSGRRFRDINRWMASTSSPVALEEIMTALRKDREAGDIMAAQVRAHWETNHETKTSIDSAIRPALYWVANEKAAAIGDSPRERWTFDFERFYEQSETIYLLGPGDENNTLAPLIAAFVTELAYVGRKLAGESFGGRLDPVATFVLDEVPNVCPVPLDHWTSYFGGQGLVIHWYAQSPGQLRERWGDNGAVVILDNTSSLKYYGGSNSARDLADLSTLMGETRRRVTEADPESLDAFRWTNVLTPGQIRSLEQGQVLLLRRGMLPIVGWAPQIRERKGWAPMPLDSGVVTETADAAGRGRIIPSQRRRSRFRRVDEVKLEKDLDPTE